MWFLTILKNFDFCQKIDILNQPPKNYFLKNFWKKQIIYSILIIWLGGWATSPEESLHHTDTHKHSAIAAHQNFQTDQKNPKNQNFEIDQKPKKTDISRLPECPMTPQNTQN